MTWRMILDIPAKILKGFYKRIFILKNCKDSVELQGFDGMSHKSCTRRSNIPCHVYKQNEYDTRSGVVNAFVGLGHVT